MTHTGPPSEYELLCRQAESRGWRVLVEVAPDVKRTPTTTVRTVARRIARVAITQIAGNGYRNEPILDGIDQAARSLLHRQGWVA